MIYLYQKKDSGNSNDFQLTLNSYKKDICVETSSKLKEQMQIKISTYDPKSKFFFLEPEVPTIEVGKQKICFLIGVKHSANLVHY